MGKRTHDTLVLLFMLQFLLWTQASAARLVCRCGHSPQEDACHTSQVKAISDDCCEVENADAGSNKSHEMLPSSTEEDHSCCSQQNNEEQDHKNINYSHSFHWCKSVCVNAEMVQSEQTLLPRTNGKTVDALAVYHPFFSGILFAAALVPVEKNHFLHTNSPPLFLLNSAFLI